MGHIGRAAAPKEEGGRGQRAETGTPWAENRQEVAAHNANCARLVGQANGKLHDGHPEHGIEQHRQHRNHQDRAPIAKLIAQFANKDQGDDRPAHTGDAPGKHITTPGSLVHE